MRGGCQCPWARGSERPTLLRHGDGIARPVPGPGAGGSALAATRGVGLAGRDQRILSHPRESSAVASSGPSCQAEVACTLALWVALPRRETPVNLAISSRSETPVRLTMEITAIHALIRDKLQNGRLPLNGIPFSFPPRASRSGTRNGADHTSGLRNISRVWGNSSALKMCDGCDASWSSDAQ